MTIVSILLAVSAAAAPGRANADWREKVLLAVNEEAAAKDVEEKVAQQDGRIQHKPLERTPRGENVIIRAKVADPSRLFAPLVFARKSGTTRFEAYTLRDQGRRGFVAVLPSSILSEGEFEYFLEAEHESGGTTRFGTPKKPFTCAAFDPPPVPVAVHLRTATPGAAVKIDDNEVGRTPLTVQLLPGPHTVSIVAPDGRSAEQHLDVKPGRRSIEVAVQLPHAPGETATLSVESDPAGANVLIDGALIGRAPWEGEIYRGEHVVAAEMDGRMREERRVIAREGRDTHIQFALTPVPKAPALSVESSPLGAAVILDGKPRGRTPYLAPLEKGRHELVLKLEGRREVGTEFVMPGDRDLTLRLDLAAGAAAGSRMVLSGAPEGATVSVDGKDVGVAPWAGELKPGTHTVAVAAAGFAREERVVTVAPNRDTAVSFPLSRGSTRSNLTIESEPQQADLSIDGQRVGMTPWTGQLPPGEHQMEVSLEGFKTVAQQVSLEAGQQLSLKMALKPSGERVPPVIAIVSDPQGAQFFIDGRFAGVTPTKVRTTPGPHEIRLVLDGYVTRSGRPVIPDKRDFELRIAVSMRPVRSVEVKPEAPTPHELARAQIATAHAASKTGDYAGALNGYVKAYEYERNPLVLFNIAQMRRKLRQYPEASRAYKSFLAEPPKGQKRAVDEAKKQLAFCEDQMKPSVAERLPLPLPAPAPAAPEDVTAPRIVHTAVASASRGRTLRLTAKIVDDDSGVATAQACWRNVWQSEYECQAMGDAGDDQFGTEVPARAVADGFAYYLEAWDNAGNGPARSGAPELPHAVAIEEPPTAPPLTMAAIQAMTPPGSPIGAVPAEFKPELAAAGQAAPLAGQVRPVEPATYNAAHEAPWKLTAFLGGARSTEQSYTDPNTQGGIGLEASRWFGSNWLTVLNGQWRSYRQQYAPITGDPTRVTLDENRWDLAGRAGYDLGALLIENGRLEIIPLAGFEYIGANNSSFGFSLFGPTGGLRAGYGLGPFTLRGVFGYTYNVLGSDSSAPSAFKSPVSALYWRAGLEFQVTSRYGLELDYVGDAIDFQQVWRVANGAAIGFSTSF